jgi:ABC-type transporter Mla subunit MlaD
MKRGMIAAVCAVATGLGAQSASADVLDRTVVTCQTTATWQVTRGGTSFADVTLDSTASTACKNLTARIEDDLNATVGTTNYAYPGFTARYDLIGAIVTGAPQFAGVASADGRVFGPVVIANSSSLTATLSGLTPAGGNIIQEHVPAGSCGSECYRTNVTLTGIWDL